MHDTFHLIFHRSFPQTISRTVDEKFHTQKKINAFHIIDIEVKPNKKSCCSQICGKHSWVVSIFNFGNWPFWRTLLVLVCVRLFLVFKVESWPRLAHFTSINYTKPLRRILLFYAPARTLHIAKQHKKCLNYMLVHMKKISRFFHLFPTTNWIQSQSMLWLSFMYERNGRKIYRKRTRK